ncbi:MAG: hypothetical protein LAT75_13215 [Candidatus Cyclonatronum sp.]|uniref:DUF6580 family putative transport protein n=1 Tax=Cyclonatronum sp. TaxID=3024185 RepID=UPI0025BC13FE|nr:DUF6580 family putative transport protein [Cyclonatronum sp.]MCC5933541.1 hypothetical protein [Balneolales bacterium]MCH8487823.1 hypothetical protein [Cyclonatronum sp.]
MLKPKFLILSLILVLAVVSRFLPFPPNVAPVAAMALFGGAYFSDKRIAFLLPLGVMLLSDLLLGLHSTLLFVYAAFGIIVGLGMLLGKEISPLRIAGASVAGSVIFYLLTNFGVWLFSPYYPFTLEGLLASYTMAIPFFHYTLLGDLFFTTVMFGSFELVRRNVPALQTA